ncbi:MAG: hypothetical protein ABSC29_01810 [Minisyncoccia bacterium]|jgi:hypothetical protein
MSTRKIVVTACGLSLIGGILGLAVLFFLSATRAVVPAYYCGLVALSLCAVAAMTFCLDKIMLAALEESFGKEVVIALRLNEIELCRAEINKILRRLEAECRKVKMELAAFRASTHTFKFGTIQCDRLQALVDDLEFTNNSLRTARSAARYVGVASVRRQLRMRPLQL